MTLDEMLDAAAAGTVEIAAGWGQGRATYGGLVAALLVARAETLVGDPARVLRSAGVSFVGPAEPGEATLAGTVLRAGSAATQVHVQLEQGGAVRAVLLGTFGADRPTALALDAAARNPRPHLPAPEQVEPVPYVAGMMPEFFQHVELRFAAGGALFSGAAEPDFGGWMRFREPPARLGTRELIALADAWPPAVLPMFDRPVNGSSVAWTFEPIDVAPGGDDPAAHWQYDVRTAAIGAGYANTSARIWDAAGRLRALSRQTVTFFG